MKPLAFILATISLLLFASVAPAVVTSTQQPKAVGDGSLIDQVLGSPKLGKRIKEETGGHFDSLGKELRSLKSEDVEDMLSENPKRKADDGRKGFVFTSLLIAGLVWVVKLVIEAILLKLILMYLGAHLSIVLWVLLGIFLLWLLSTIVAIRLFAPRAK